MSGSNKPQPDAAPPNKGGRPAFEPNEQHRKTVRALTAFGATQMDIARVIEVSVPTLRQYFWRELEVGAIDANAKVAQSLFNRACGDGPQSITAAIFWLKCRAGWTEEGPMPPMGKKEQAQVDAQTAGTDGDWGDDLTFGDDASIN